MHEPPMLKRRAAPCVAQLSFHRLPRPATWPATACVRPRAGVGESEYLLPESAAYPKPRRMRKPLATPATADESVKLGYRHARSMIYSDDISLPIRRGRSINRLHHEPGI